MEINIENVKAAYKEADAAEKRCCVRFSWILTRFFR